MKLIFLDIDGVLINGPSCRKRWDNPDPECVAALNKITDETGALIVVSSCWRIGCTVPELRDLLRGWGVTGKIIDRTGETRENRGCEIGAWLQGYTRHEVENFVILDDDADMESLSKYLIQSEFRTGLTTELANKAIEHLAGTQLVPIM